MAILSRWRNQRHAQPDGQVDSEVAGVLDGDDESRLELAARQAGQLRRLEPDLLPLIMTEAREGLLEPEGAADRNAGRIDDDGVMALFGRIDSNDEPALDKSAAIVAYGHGNASLQDLPVITVEPKKLPIKRQSQKI
jgi:hypothetical protein